MRWLAGGVVVAMGVASAFGQAPPAKGVNFYSLEAEAAIGRELAARLTASLPVVHDQRLDAYLARITGLLAQNADRRFAYRFMFFDDRRAVPVGPVGMAMPLDAFQGAWPEPVALPGGPILVPLSLLANAPDEAAFAFQLAHALAHVELRHGTGLATRQELTSLAIIPLQNVAARADVAGALPMTIELSFLTLARNAELRADSTAVELAAAAGYDPESMANVLASQSAGAGSRVWAPRPEPGRRLATVRAALEKLPPRTYRAPSAEFDEARMLAAEVR